MDGSPNTRDKGRLRGKKKSIGESIKKIFWVNSLSEDIIYDKTLQCHWFI